MPQLTTIYSIGHGRHAWKDFLAILQKFEIEFVCDVRNFARSRWPQFNGQVLSANLYENGIGYEHLPECGGKLVATPDVLNAGVRRIAEVAAELTTVMMCSESHPLTSHKIRRANCHRVGLLAPILRDIAPAKIIHILPNGDSIEFDESAVPSVW